VFQRLGVQEEPEGLERQAEAFEKATRYIDKYALIDAFSLGWHIVAPSPG